MCFGFKSFLSCWGEMTLRIHAFYARKHICVHLQQGLCCMVPFT